MAGRLDDAEAMYRDLANGAGGEQARFFLGQVLLTRGAYREGWAMFEHRPQRAVPLARWRGEALHGQSILIHGEQGFGDNIQFARFIPEVARRGGKVALACKPGLEGLLRPLDGVDSIVGEGRGVDAAIHCPMMSLPHVLGVGLDDLPGAMPYLSPPAPLAAAWQRRLSGPGLKVGLVWAGNPEFSHDHLRSPGLAALLPLLTVPGVTLFGLQLGPRAAEAAMLPAGAPFVDLGPSLTSFEETAAAMAALDLVICSCTAAANLAGALGIPFWVLLAYAPDWRWLRGRDDSPWYPSARLFRQSEPGAWGAPVEAMRLALAGLSAAAVAPAGPAEALHRLGGEAAQAGRVAEARGLLEQAVTAHRAFPEAWNTLGIARRGCGDVAGAADAFAEAARLRPAFAQAEFHLGLALGELGRIPEAQGALRRAVCFRPDFASAHAALAGMLSRSGHPQAALVALDRAVELEPDLLPAHFNRALTLSALGRDDDAGRAYLRILRIEPGHTDSLLNLGNLLIRLGRLDDARRAFETGLEYHPADSRLLTNLGLLLVEMNEISAALEVLGRGVAADPASDTAQAALAFALHRADRLDDSLAAYDAVLALAPATADLLGNRADVLMAAGRFVEAEADFLRAMRLAPGHFQARLGHALALLGQGRLAEGWDAYERRPYKANGEASDYEDRPRWTGEPTGHRVVLWGEQGIADELMYATCLPEALARLDHVTIQCLPKLMPLFRRSFPTAAVVSRHDSPNDFDLHLPIASLPRLFRRRIEDFPAEGAVLCTDSEADARCRRQLAALGPAPYIGVSWRSGIRSAARSLLYPPFAELEPLLAQGPATFVSLQYDDDGAERAALEANTGIVLHRLAGIDMLNDLDTTASLMRALDLVITTNTAVHTLAGMVGRPTWVFAPEQMPTRLGTDHIPWLPTATLFLRHRGEDWPAVIARLTTNLKSLINDYPS